MSMRGRIHDGDPEAFRDLFRDGVRAVFNHAYRLTGDPSVAEDVVSLTFLEAWRLRRSVDTGPDGGSLRPWLLGIATNVARNLRRSARRHAAAMARLPAGPVEPDFADDLTARIDDQLRLARTRTALAALRQPEREVLTLCVWAGLDYAETAAALGVPVGTVRSRLSRARARLARLVQAGLLDPADPAREPGPGRGQVGGDREPAVPFAGEDIR